MATKVEKIIRLNKFQIIKYQLMHYCFMKNLKLNDTELNCLALMGELGQIRLTEFGKIATARGFLANSISVNNCLYRMEHRGLFVKKGSGKKVISLHPELNIQSEGTILIDLKIIKVEADASKRSVQKNSAEAELA